MFNRSKYDLLQKRYNEELNIPYLKMQELVTFYISRFATVNQTKTKEAIIRQLDSIKKTSANLQTIDFELAMIKVLETHISLQTSVEMEIYEAADVDLLLHRSTAMARSTSRSSAVFYAIWHRHSLNRGDTSYETLSTATRDSTRTATRTILN